jgi:hypothetical protein
MNRGLIDYRMEGAHRVVIVASLSKYLKLEGSPTTPALP